MRPTDKSKGVGQERLRNPSPAHTDIAGNGRNDRNITGEGSGAFGTRQARFERSPNRGTRLPWER